MDVKINATAFKNMPPAPEYSFLFSFEKNFEPEIELQWIRTHWVHSIYWCLAYILLMFCGKVSFMRIMLFFCKKLVLSWSELVLTRKPFHFTVSDGKARTVQAKRPSFCLEFCTLRLQCDWNHSSSAGTGARPAVFWIALFDL